MSKFFSPAARLLTTRDERHGRANISDDPSKLTILDVADNVPMHNATGMDQYLVLDQGMRMLEDGGSKFAGNAIPPEYYTAEFLSHLEDKDYLDYGTKKTAAELDDRCAALGRVGFIDQMEREADWWKHDKNVKKIVQLAREIRAQFPNHRICSLGQSPAWIVKACQALQEKDGQEINVGYIPYSKQIVGSPVVRGSNKTDRYYYFYRQTDQVPTLEACRSYMNYLKSMDLSPEDIIRNASLGKKTLILEYAESGAGLASFLSILVIYAQQAPDQSKVSIQRLLASIDVVTLNVPTRRYPITTVRLPDITDVLIRCTPITISPQNSHLIDWLSRNDDTRMRYLPSYSDELWLTHKFHRTIYSGKYVMSFPKEGPCEVTRSDRYNTAITCEIINVIRKAVGLQPDVMKVPSRAETKSTKSIFARCLNYFASLPAVKFMLYGKRTRAAKKSQRLNAKLSTFVDRLNNERERATKEMAIAFNR